MQNVDYVVLTLYLAAVFLLGVLLSFKTKSSNDMFAAGGESPAWTSGLSAFMCMFTAGTFVVWGGIAFKHGLVAIAINLCYGVAALLVGRFVAGRWKELGVRTPAEFITLRFGAKAVQFYTWSMMLYRLVSVGVALFSLAVILVALMPLPEGHFLRDPVTGNMSLIWAIVIFGATVITYTMVGGLWGVLMTDVLQFIILNIAVLFVIPLSLKSVGGFSNFIHNAPENFFALTLPGKYTWFFLAGWAAIHFFMIGAEWAFAQRFICVSSAKDARKSIYLFGGLYLISPFLWMLPPLLYRQINPTANPDQAYILACKSVLPVGMVGCMLAAMFAATASSVSGQLNVFAGVLTEQFYHRIFRPEATEKQLIKAGRIFTVLLGALVMGFALSIPYLGGAEKVVISVTSLMVGPLLAPTIWGLLGRRITARAVAITAGVSFSTGIVCKLILKLSGTTVDVLIGVVLPIAILCIMHFLQKGTAEGWVRVEHLERKTRESGIKTKASRTPAVVVAVSLVCFAIMMFSLTAFNGPEVRGLLIGFGVGLLAISLWIFAVLKKTREPGNA